MARIIRVEGNRLILLSGHPRIKTAFRQICYIHQIDPDTGELPEGKNSKEFVDYFEDFVWCWANPPWKPLDFRQVLRGAKSLNDNSQNEPIEGHTV